MDLGGPMSPPIFGVDTHMVSNVHPKPAARRNAPSSMAPGSEPGPWRSRVFTDADLGNYRRVFPKK